MASIQSISSGLTLGGDGIWYGVGASKVSYPDDGHHACLAVEDRSFWFRHRNACIKAAIAAYPPDDHGTIFDIGGGNGFVSLALAKAGYDMVLVEPGRSGAVSAKQRGLPHVVCATTSSARFHPCSLPAVGLFDVIEHIADEVAFLCTIRELMRPSGLLYITVPAYPLLWSADDVTAGHFRRYTRRSITRTLAETGFSIEFATYFFRFLPFPIFALRTTPFILGITRKKQLILDVERDHAVRGGISATILRKLLQPEVAAISLGKPLKFGGSCLVVARRCA